LNKPAHALLPQAIELLAVAAGLYPIEGPVQCGKKLGFDVARKKTPQGGDGMEVMKIFQPSCANIEDNPNTPGHNNAKISNFALEESRGRCKAAMWAG
jgi:hypothetical protein